MTKWKRKRLGQGQTTETTGRKRKSEMAESRFSPPTSVDFKARRLEEDSTSAASSRNSATCESFGSESDILLASCCSSNECSDDLAKGSEKLVDLEEAEAEATTLESLPNRRGHALQKTPSEAEIEKFFAAAEKNLQEQFLHKYNYDIVKDKPMEGHYVWVQNHQN